MVLHTHTHTFHIFVDCAVVPHSLLITSSYYYVILYIRPSIFQKKTSIYCAGGSLTQKHVDDKAHIYIYISTQYTSYICNQFRLPQSHQASSWPGLRRVCAGLGLLFPGIQESMIHQGVSPVLGSFENRISGWWF